MIQHVQSVNVFKKYAAVLFVVSADSLYTPNAIKVFRLLVKMSSIHFNTNHLFHHTLLLYGHD